MIQTKRKAHALIVMRVKIKINKVTDMYQTKTLRKVGQMGKQVQKRKPPINPVVMR